MPPLTALACAQSAISFCCSLPNRYVGRHASRSVMMLESCSAPLSVARQHVLEYVAGCRCADRRRKSFGASAGTTKWLSRGVHRCCPGCWCVCVVVTAARRRSVFRQAIVLCVLSWHVVSCRVMSRHFVSCRVLCRVLRRVPSTVDRTGCAFQALRPGSWVHSSREAD